MPAVITENDVSQWNDKTGASYHFPKRYLPLLEPGTPVIYYKGKLTEASFRSLRLSAEPHYFGLGTIGEVSPDRLSQKNYFYATIRDFQEFETAVAFRDSAGAHYETIPSNRKKNYWRDGVRPISQQGYNQILQAAGISPANPGLGKAEAETNDVRQGLETIVWVASGTEGKRKQVFTTVMERDARLRAAALKEHGAVCRGCDFDFGEFYGPEGAGFIHIHHLKPLAEGVRQVVAKTDLVPLCANCHSMVHRRRDQLLSLETLISLIQQHGKWSRFKAPSS